MIYFKLGEFVDLELIILFDEDLKNKNFNDY